MTSEQRQKLLHNGTKENRDQDHSPVVRLFLPATSCTWLLSELSHEDPDIAFGLCDLGMGSPELGSVRVSELEQLTVLNGIFGVEQDINFTDEYPMSVYAFAANMNDMITTDRVALQKADEALKQRKSDRSRSPS